MTYRFRVLFRQGQKVTEQPHALQKSFHQGSFPTLQSSTKDSKSANRSNTDTLRRTSGDKSQLGHGKTQAKRKKSLSICWTRTKAFLRETLREQLLHRLGSFDCKAILDFYWSGADFNLVGTQTNSQPLILMKNELIDWLTGRLTDWPTGLLNIWLITDWLTYVTDHDWPTDWLTVWLIIWLFDWLITNCFTDSLYTRPTDWGTEELTDWRTDWII